MPHPHPRTPRLSHSCYALRSPAGFALTKETLLSMAGMPSVTIMQHLKQEQGLKFDHEAAALEKQRLYASLAEGATKTIGPVMQTAIEAKRRGIPCAVATGGSRLQVEPAMRAAGIDQFFSVVVTCDDVKIGKPHPETFLLAAERLGVDPKLCVGFEDAPKGLEAIRAAGFLAAIDVTTFDWYPRDD